VPQSGSPTIIPDGLFHPTYTGSTLVKDHTYTVQKEESVRLYLLMQRENILYMTDTIDVASLLADFYVLYKFASLEYVECAGILITLLITYSSDANLDNK
jgi:hypothetical protein